MSRRSLIALVPPERSRAVVVLSNVDDSGPMPGPTARTGGPEVAAIVGRMAEPRDPSLGGDVEPGPMTPAETEGHQPGGLRRAGGAVRGLTIDITPLRESRDYRLLWIGELISTTGRQISVVALPLQVFLLTRSSLDVGLIGL